jgi:hypothetical protein
MDHYVAGFTAWLQNEWYLWIALGLAVVVVISAVAISKARTKAHARVPHYRRHR